MGKYIIFLIIIPVVIALIQFVRYLTTLPSAGLLAIAMLLYFGYFGARMLYQGVLGIKNKNMILLGRTIPDSKIKGKTAVLFGVLSFLFGLWIVGSVLFISYFAFIGR